MIRLNDIYKTVIDEKEIKGYGKNDDSEGINLIISSKAVFAEYNSYKTRDKDIELLDKIFDVEDIEYKAMSVAKPELYSNEGDINEESKLVNEGEYDPVKKEEYLTWKDVKQYATGIKAQLPNGETYRVFYDIDYARIRFYSPYGDNFNGAIYDEDLFNALKLKEAK